MQDSKWRNGVALVLFAFCLLAIVMLALTSTTWAAPGAQGTVPTPPEPTSTIPTAIPPATSTDGTNNGGNDNGGSGGDSGGSTDTGGSSGAGSVGQGSVCSIGSDGATCSAENLILVVGAGAAGAGSALNIEGSLPQPPCPASPTGFLFLNRCYRFTWTDSNAQALESLSGPVLYCISFGPEQLAAAANNPDAFSIGLADATGTWTLVKPTLDAPTGRVCATSNQMVQWSALFAPQSGVRLLPTVGAQFDSWWLVPLVALGLLLLFLLVGAIRVRRKTR